MLLPILIATKNTDCIDGKYIFYVGKCCSPPDPKENIPKYLLSDEQKLHIALIGALPNKGIEHVRIHWLLNLLTTQ